MSGKRSDVGREAKISGSVDSCEGRDDGWVDPENPLPLKGGRLGPTMSKLSTKSGVGVIALQQPSSLTSRPLAHPDPVEGLYELDMVVAKIGSTGSP